MKLALPLTLLIVVLVAYWALQSPTQQETLTESTQESVQTTYVTWDTREYDKCVAYWLIKRYVDPTAEIKFIKKDTPITEGIAFDVPGEKWSRQHLKSTSDCIIETIENPDDALKTIVFYAHNVELNFWQLTSFEDSQKSFFEVKAITDSVEDTYECYAQLCVYFDNLYQTLKTKSN